MTMVHANSNADGMIFGELNFTCRDHELDHDPAIYLKVHDPPRERPKKPYWKELHSLRPELTHLKASSDAEQLQTIRRHLAHRGFATVHHHSQVLEQRGINTQADYSAFVLENLNLLKKVTGADEIILWNSTKRQSTATTSETTADGYVLQSRPQGIESRFDSGLEPPAIFAHIDQDSYQGARVCSMSIAGTPSLLDQDGPMDPFEAIDLQLSKRYSRTMIINLWRPVGGTVYDKPLAVADYRSLDKGSISRWASPYGCGYDVHEHSAQKWHFIPHQTNDEVLIFKCYDALSLKDEVEALYGAHCAVASLKGKYPTPPAGAPPRKSVEFRFVAVWR